MFKYILEKSELNDILKLLYKLFDIRITFFDLHNMEIDYFNIKPLSAYCSFKREDPVFYQKCIACDRLHLARAKKSKAPLIYTCHSGLLEGIIPLYDKDKYFGALVFGQVQSPDAILIKTQDEDQTLFNKLPIYSKEHLNDIAELLKRLSEYIVIKELIKYNNRQWVIQLEEYIQENIGIKISNTDMAHHIQKSESFISHFFRTEFGMSPKQFVLKRKLEQAKIRLLNGAWVREVALDLGFYDEFHFSKAFKKMYGKSPGFYKS